LSATGPVLLSWVAVQNDPYERERGSKEFIQVESQRVPGPTLTLLFDDASPYKGQVREVVLLHNQFVGAKKAYEQTADEIRQRSQGIRVRPEVWQGEDPTDHKAIFEFLRTKVPELRRRYPDQELLVHVSPGTPSMHTLWVLMAETGFIEPPFKLVKSYRKDERKGRAAVMPVEVGIETFYKRYLESRPAQVSSQEEAVFWDPARFQSAPLKALYIEARRFARLQVPVLILGERGTGKTTLASWMRQHSAFRRAEQDRSWPAVACGQYSPQTMRAELFGHCEGAFTDAKGEREGLLAAAHGDTLFLDEVGDVSRDLQRLLIKALEEKKYLRLGDTKPRTSNFRLLTATNLPLATLRERLDPDFLDRIGLLKLRLPALRDIPEDLPWLWETVYQQARQRSSIPEQKARLGEAHHARVVRALREHPLPGNLRDLFHVAYRLLAARNDPEEPLAPEEAVTYALEGDGPGSHPGEEVDLPREVARAFALSQPLDSLLRPGTRLLTRELDEVLKSYMAQELRRIATDRRVKVEQLCDVSSRTLRIWAEDDEPEPRKKTSGTAEV
jgi:DNA-binding NtrC family response regulator